ncbi:MAG: head completion protein [Acidimicrobiia bacterium]|nr:head completion protein [Acidimicrobiia bacterium]
MSIKNVRPTNNSGFVQGYFTPTNPEKYIGPTPIIYRSSWERKFMIMCDTKDNVVKWASEPVEIKYIWSFDKREHKYYPDFYMKTKTEDGFEEFLVEIKPEAQIKKPQPPKKRSKGAIKSYKFLAEQYVKNMDKYKYAKAWSENRGWRFIVLTEKSLK